MSWVTIIWSMIASVSFTLAIIYLLIWFRERRSWAYLCFFVMAAGVIGLAAGELAAMHARTPAEYGAAVRWSHFAFGFVAVGSLGFVHFYFGTGKGWLFGAALGLRLLAVVANFTTGLNLHIGAIQSLQPVSFLGEPVSMLGVWTLNPWVRLGQFAALVQIVYVVDASLRLWRAGGRESRRRALIVGGPLAFFILFSSAQAGLVVQGVLRMPIVVSFPFLAVLLAMSYELSRDVLRAAQLGRELRESEHQMILAAEAANLGVWVRDLVRHEIWASANWRELFSFAPAERLNLEKFLQRLHPADRENFQSAVLKATNGDGRYETEFRVGLPDGRMRWMSSRGRVEFNGGGKPVRVRGISQDITARKQAEAETLRQRSDLAHLSRVTMLGELSGSMAHELNQPLTAILSNAQAAQRFLAHEDADMNEVRDILKDIVEQDNRAGEIIHRLRLLLKKGEVHQQPLDLNDVVQEVLKLIRSDLVNQNVAARVELAAGLPPVKGDRVQLQQVLLNLVMNACDAMNGNAPADRQLVVRTELSGDGNVCVSVADVGPGLAPDKLEQVFEPFYTTKTNGLGLGLSVCRTIISAHGGNLRAANGAARGAVFNFTIPSLPDPQT
jgi:two-component system, LuxR family, sensor kinase FixL